MKSEVATGIDELKRQFAGATFTVREDNQGGAYVIMEPFDLGPKFNPPVTWMGFHIPAQYPYADIYPVFVGDNVAAQTAHRLSLLSPADTALKDVPPFRFRVEMVRPKDVSKGRWQRFLRSPITWINSHEKLLPPSHHSPRF